MSIQSMTWALEQKAVTDATSRHVLLCLANYADKGGRSAFPSAASLAEDTGLSERTVRYKLDHLESMGVIRRGNQAIAAAYIDRHDRRPVVYDMAFERGAADAPRTERGANEVATGCSSEQNGVQMKTERGAGAAPNPSSIRQLPVNKPKEGAQAPEPGKKNRKSSGFDPAAAKPANVSDRAWADFCEMRKAKRAPLTKRACEMIATKLAKHPDPSAVLDKSTLSSWTDVYPESVLPGAGARLSPPGQPQSAVLHVPTHTQSMYPDDRF